MGDGINDVTGEALSVVRPMSHREQGDDLTQLFRQSMALRNDLDRLLVDLRAQLVLVEEHLAHVTPREDLSEQHLRIAIEKVVRIKADLTPR